MNSEYITMIEKIVSDGSGMGRNEGKVIFIPYTIPGEIISYKAVNDKKDYTEAEIDSIISPSDDRIKPECPYFTHCGGCDFQHIRYSSQQIVKENILKELFIKNGNIEITEEINYFPSSPLHYRNHIDFTGFKEGFGFRKRKSKHTIHIEHCLIARKEINDILSNIQPYRDIIKRMYIIDFRVSTSGQTMLTLYPGKRTIPENDILQLADISADNILYVKNRKLRILKGHSDLTDVYDNAILSYSRSNFMQTNHQITLKMLKYIDSLTENGHKLLDLYSGVGLFSMYLAYKYNEVISVEGSMQSVIFQRNNAKSNNIKNIKIVQRDISDSFIIEPSSFDCIIADPPRCGISSLFLYNLLKSNIDRFIYVSCNPATLARDSSILMKHGFSMNSIAIFDMFPQTRHFETVIVFTKTG